MAVTHIVIQGVESCWTESQRRIEFTHVSVPRLSSLTTDSVFVLKVVLIFTGCAFLRGVVIGLAVGYWDGLAGRIVVFSFDTTFISEQLIVRLIKVKSSFGKIDMSRNEGLNTKSVTTSVARLLLKDRICIHKLCCVVETLCANSSC